MQTFPPLRLSKTIENCVVSLFTEFATGVSGK